MSFFVGEELSRAYAQDFVHLDGNEAIEFAVTSTDEHAGIFSATFHP